MAKVSVIIPTYNDRVEFLRAAIQSVRKQTFQDFEILIVDDGSTGETASAVQSFGDGRIRYLRHDCNRGEAATRNTGIRHASGLYIAFLDDDDEWLPDKLAKQVEFLARCPATLGIVYTGFWRIDGSDGRVIGQWTPVQRGDVYRSMCVQNWIGTPSTVLVRKECFQRVGDFDESIAYGADYDMWLRISRRFAVDFIPEPLIRYTVHENSMSSNCELLIKGKEEQLRRYHQQFAGEGKSYSSRHLSLGVLYCYNNQLHKGRAAFLQAMRLDPFNPRHYFNFGLSLFGTRFFRKIKSLKESRSARAKCETLAPLSQ